MNQTFADTVGNITVTGGLVRIDFVSLAPRQPEDPQAPRQFEITQRVVLPMDGFLRGMAAQQDMMKKLVDAGVLTMKPNPDTATG
ncbi:MAG: hypothetical protein JNK22_16985 [Rhodocyclaceae bacterium]|nr:hypothetical protein [Rhodocyclaceae bacterium]